MTTAAEHKEHQGYDPKPVTNTCGNCRHLSVTRVLPKWAQDRNDAYGKGLGTVYYGDRYKREQVRCGLGTFAVKKTGTCNVFLMKKILWP